MLVLVSFAHTVVAEKPAATGEILIPAGNEAAHLASFDIRVIVNEEQARFSAAYYLMSDDADTVTVGFRGGSSLRWEKFKAFTDTDLSVTGKNGAGIPFERSFRVPLAARGTVKEVMTQFESPVDRSGPLGIEDIVFTFALAPGAAWKQPVEDGVVTVYLESIDPDRITVVSPEGFTRDNNRFTWHFTDFTPSGEIRIAVMDSRQFYTLNTALTMLRMKPDNAHAHFLVGAVYFLRSLTGQKDMTAKAVAELEKAVELHPRHTDARFFLAALRHGNGEREKALEQIREIVKMEPSYACVNKLFPDALYERLPAKTPAEWLKAAGKK